MRNAIWEYVVPSETEKEELWKTGVFVFDTNVLLNLYRYTSKTRNSLLSAFDDLQERIWIPNQVVKEFAKRRFDVIYETVDKYSSIESKKDSFVKTCSEELRLKPSDDAIQELNKEINSWIEKQKQKNILVTNPSKDTILEHLLKIFDGHVGEEYDDQKLENIKKEGKERYEKNVPPGFRDSKKEKDGVDNNAYGDLIVWKQILDYALKNKKDIIFVTHDQKEDWWQKVKGKTIGPHVDLKKEFKEKTSMKFYMYSMDGFIQYFAKTKGNHADDAIVAEVKAVAKKKTNKKADNLHDYSMTLEKNIINLNHRIMRRQQSIMGLETKYKDKEMPLEAVVQLENTRKKTEELMLQKRQKEALLQDIRKTMFLTNVIEF